jgi:orotate phosphoribosyltransferase
MPPADDRERLKSWLCRYSVRFGEFKLVSGQTSNVYVDAKLTTYRAEAMPLVGRLFLEKLRERCWRPAAVGGLSLGADPIAMALAHESRGSDLEVNAFVVRKEAKKHGMMRFIEGLADPGGVPVVILDDVCTTGGSTITAIERARQSGMEVLGAICLVDREMGAPRNIEAQNCPFDRIFALSELKAHYDAAPKPEVLETRS